MLKIGGKFIQKGKFKATCPECLEVLKIKNNGEVEEIKCLKCGHIFIKANLKKNDNR